MRVIAFDFDGVLVDSYYALPKVYAELGLEVEPFIEVEDAFDYLGLWDKRWFFERVGVDNERYWELRTKYSLVLYDVERLTKKVRERGWSPIIVCGCDDSVERKLRRVGKLGKYFDEIRVYGCESRYKDLREALKRVNAYVDDKPANLNKLKGLGLKLFLHKFRPNFPLALSWSEKLEVEAVILSDLFDILNYI